MKIEPKRAQNKFNALSEAEQRQYERWSRANNPQDHWHALILGEWRVSAPETPAKPPARPVAASLAPPSTSTAKNVTVAPGASPARFAPAPSASDEAAFERAYLKYPETFAKSVQKEAARIAYRNIKPEDRVDFLAAVEAYAQQCKEQDTQEIYIKKFTSFCNGGWLEVDNRKQLWTVVEAAYARLNPGYATAPLSDLGQRDRRCPSAVEGQRWTSATLAAWLVERHRIYCAEFSPEAQERRRAKLRAEYQTYLIEELSSWERPHDKSYEEWFDDSGYAFDFRFDPSRKPPEPKYSAGQVLAEVLTYVPEPPKVVELLVDHTPSFD